MIIFSLISVILALFTYYVIGLKVILDKKVFSAQFAYIVFYFLISPFLHYYFNTHAADLQFIDFVSSLITLNMINSIGLLFSLLGICIAKYFKPSFNFTTQKINWKRLFKISLAYFFLATIYYIYLANTSSLFYTESKSEFEDPSLLRFMILESTPIIFAWLLISYIKLKKTKNFLFYFIVFIVITVLYAGLRGSRVTVLINVLNFVILYIFLVKKISYTSVFAIIFFGLSFNTLYSNYKYGGVEGVKSYFSTGERPSYIANKENETLHYILSDLARGDVQAKVIESLEYSQYKPPYTPQSYIDGALLVVPDDLNPFDFDSKRILGTDALYGFKGNEYYASTRIYGLLGESMLNFGFYLVPFSFLLFGVVHYLSNSFIASSKNSSFILFLPIFFFLPIYLLFYDFGNIVFQIIKNWLIPAGIFYLYSLRNNKFE